MKKSIITKFVSVALFIMIVAAQFQNVSGREWGTDAVVDLNSSMFGIYQTSSKTNIFPPSAFSTKAAPFTLQDQFGNRITVKFPSDKVCILVFGDREGSEQIEGWVRPLYNKYKNNIYIFGIAELSAVPWVARPVVRGIIKNKSKNPIMLDWKGNVSKSYGYEKKKANVFVINKSGYIVSDKRGAASQTALSALYGAIDSVL